MGYPNYLEVDSRIVYRWREPTTMYLPKPPTTSQVATMIRAAMHGPEAEASRETHEWIDSPELFKTREDGKMHCITVVGETVTATDKYGIKTQRIVTYVDGVKRRVQLMRLNATPHGLNPGIKLLDG